MIRNMTNVTVQYKNSRKTSYVIGKEITSAKRPRFEMNYSNISDEEALRRANGLSHHSNHSQNQSTQSMKKRYQGIGLSRSISANAQMEQEEPRHPGLYGCNRWASKRKEQAEQSEVFNIF